VVDSVLVLQYAENEGAFLGLGSRLPPAARTGILVALPLAALAAIVVSMLRARTLSWLLLTGLSLIAGGGLGNLLDRLLRGGRVSDFLNLGIGNLRTGIFNIADLAVLVGCVLLLLSPGDRPRRAAGSPGKGDTTAGDRGSGRIPPGDRDSGPVPPTS
jgi:signal peptidase II